MVSKLNQQTLTSELKSHWVPYSLGLMPHLSKELIGFTFLYFKMTVVPLVPETKIADVGKLIKSREPIGQESHVVRNFDFVPRFWSRLHDKNCLYILSSFKNSSFPFRLTETTRSLTLRLTETTHSFHFDFQRQHTLLYI